MNLDGAYLLTNTLVIYYKLVVVDHTDYVKVSVELHQDHNGCWLPWTNFNVVVLVNAPLVLQCNLDDQR